MTLRNPAAPAPDAAALARAIETGSFDSRLRELYAQSEIAGQRARYLSLLRRFQGLFGPGPVRLVSSPGRTELGGNHTDHNQGKVLAASIQLDSIAAVRPQAGMGVELHSEGYTDPFKVDLSDLARREEEAGRSEALIRGIAARLVSGGSRVGGFVGCMASSVARGSGLSSSASVEILIGSVFNLLFNDGGISSLALAITGQYAENNYFGKPCGLMDQIACSTGGIVAIDFLDPLKPEISQIDVDFTSRGLSLIVVDTGGSHADLTADYAAIPSEMRAVASELGGAVCRDIRRSDLLSALPAIRAAVGDRAVLRALHFFDENERVERQAEALRAARIDDYLAEVRSSGRSSMELLQNGYPISASREQGIPLALALSEPFVRHRGAARVHGGGFAGTIQSYVPLERVDEYRALMSRVFGPKAVTRLSVRPRGVVALT